MRSRSEHSSLRAGVGNILILGVVALVVASGTGVVLARYLTSSAPAQAENVETLEPDRKTEPDSAFVPFGAVVVNLAEGRLTRYLKVNVTLRVEKPDKPALTKIMESGQKAVFKNWLITYLSGLKLNDVKGSEAVERLRKKICAGFNDLLANKSDAQIKEVFFEEFNVQ